MIRHKSTAYVADLVTRARNRRAIEELSKQFRYIIRMAVACHNAGVDYDCTWTLQQSRMCATVTCQGDSLPTAKALPKAPALKLVAQSWNPKQWEAAYTLDAVYSKPAGCAPRMVPGMVIEHSSGLCLTLMCETGEWGTETGDADPNGKWALTHRGSGMGFGIELPLARATKALLFAASQDVDWTLDADTLKALPNFQRAGLETRSAFDCKSQRIEAGERLERMAA